MEKEERISREGEGRKGKGKQVIGKVEQTCMNQRLSFTVDY